MQLLIPVLCVDRLSNYHHIPGLDLYTKERNAYLYTGTSPAIHHPPCQQWSRMKAFATPNKEEKELALFCWEIVNRDGGILEHPAGSSLFRYVGADRKKIVSINQSWFGFPAQKRTYLYFSQVTPQPTPICFDAIPKKVNDITSTMRSRMPLLFYNYLVNCIKYECA